jgi:hypothetical protein
MVKDNISMAEDGISTVEDGISMADDRNSMTEDRISMVEHGSRTLKNVNYMVEDEFVIMFVNTLPISTIIFCS